MYLQSGTTDEEMIQDILHSAERHKVDVFDDVMYMAYEQQDAHSFFQFIYEMYDKCVFVLTSNKGPGEWGKFLGDKTLTTAILDHLLHRSEILTLSEEQNSIRMKYRKALFNEPTVES